jgi:hypothetical protein
MCDFSLKRGQFRNATLREDWLSVSKQLGIANSSVAKGRLLCFPLFSMLGFGLACVCMGLVPAVTIARSLCVQLSLVLIFPTVFVTISMSKGSAVF